MAKKFSKSEKELLMAILRIKSLKMRTRAGLLNYKRHDVARDRLKEKGIIAKGEDNFLYVMPNHIDEINKMFNEE